MSSDSSDSSDSDEDLLGEEQHVGYDAAVNCEVQRDKCLAQIPPKSIVFPYLLANIARFSGGVIDALFQTYNEISLDDQDSLTDKLNLAWKSGSYREIRNLAQLRQATEWSPCMSDDDMADEAIRLAWLGKYHGDHHKVMLNNINSMERGPGHASFANVVQSSGSGKSRTVDEIANLVFTIPFNIRNPSGLAYPPEDADVWQYLRSSMFSTMEEGERDVALFFWRLFAEVAHEVKRVFCVEKKLSQEELAR